MLVRVLARTYLLARLCLYICIMRWRKTSNVSSFCSGPSAPRPSPSESVPLQSRGNSQEPGSGVSQGAQGHGTQTCKEQRVTGLGHGSVTGCLPLRGEAQGSLLSTAKIKQVKDKPQPQWERKLRLLAHGSIDFRAGDTAFYVAQVGL